MADTYVQITNTGQTVFSLPFSSNYLLKSHIKVYKGRDLLAETQTSTLSDGTDYNFTSATQITLTSGLASGEELTIQRQTPKDSQLSPWSDGSNLTSEALNNADLQNLYIVQEQADLNALGATKAIAATTAATSATATANAAQATANAALSRQGGTMTGDIAMGTNRITGLSDPASATEPVIKSYFEEQSWDNTTETIASNETWAGNNTKIATTGAIDGRIDSKIDTAIEGDVLAGTDLTKTQTGGQVTLNHSVTGASSVNNSNGVVLQDLTINPRGHITGHASIDLDTLYYTENELDAGQLDNRYYTETELLTNGVLDTRYFTQTAADARYYNLASGEEIQSGETWTAADNKIATTAAIDARIIDLVDDVGGFVPIANETSFPAANPDVNNAAGTLVSIKEIANTQNVSSGVVTIQNGAGTGNTVTITGVNGAFTAGFGVIVETTSTLHTYTFHRYTPKATEVTTVAGNSSNITTVATNIANINTVASDLNETTSEIDTVANAITNVNTVGNAIANVNTTATNIANINTVASDLNETTSEIDTVATNIANVNTVGTSIANVNTVANDLNETTSEIDTVATNIANVNVVGNAITNVNNVGGSISNVNTVATNLADVSNFADRYQIASSDPSARADSSSLQEGDQYFNTSSDVLKVYTGSAWNTGVTDASGFATKTGETFTGNVGVPAASNGAPGLFIAGDTDTGIYSPGANLLAITASGTNVLQVGSSGVTINGTHTASSYSGNLNASQLNTGTVPTARLGSGTASNTTFLRGDGSWQVVSTDLNNDTTPQLGGNLEVNTKNILFGDSSDGTTDDVLKFGAGTDLSIYSDGTDGILKVPDTGELNVLQGSNTLATFSGANNKIDFYEDVLFQGASSRNVLWDKSESSLEFADNASALFGTGGDLTVAHYSSGNLSRIHNSGAGGLDIKSTSGEIRFKSESGGSEQTGATYTPAAGWSFGHAGATRITTNTSGVDINGHLTLSDSDYIQLGDSQDLQLGNNGTNNFIQATGSLLQIVTSTDHPIQLKHNSTTRLATSSNGVEVTGGLTVSGQLTVNGTTTTIDSTTLQVEDKNIEIGKVGSPSDTTADGGGLSLLGSTTKTFNWVNSTDAWTSSEHIELASGKRFIGNGSSLTSLNASNLSTGTVADARIATLTASKLTGALPAISGANLTNLPPGGNIVSLVANGSIAANKAIALQTDGKVKQVAIEVQARTTPVQAGTSVFSFSEARAPDCTWIGNLNKIAITSALNGTVHVTSVTSASNTTSTSWTGFSYASTSVGVSGRDSLLGKNRIRYNSDTNNILLFYSNNGSNAYVKFVQLSSSDNSVTLGSSAYQFSSDSNVAFMEADYDENADRMVVGWSEFSQGNRHGQIRTVNESGTGSGASASFGTKYEFNNSETQHCNVTYHKAAGKTIVSYMANGDKLWVQVVTVSSNGSMSFGTAVDVTGTASTGAHRMTYDEENEKLVCCYGRSNRLYTRVGTVSGTSTTWGSEVGPVDDGDGSSVNDIAYDQASKRIGYIYRHGTNNIRFKMGAVSGTSVTVSTHHQVSQAEQRLPTLTGWGTKGYFFGAATYGSWYADGQMWVWYTTVQSNTMANLNRYLGFSETSKTNGQTIDIKTYGNTVSGFSGLTIGTTYYVQGDGSIATTTDLNNFPFSISNTPIAGVAIAADKLLVSQPYQALHDSGA